MQSKFTKQQWDKINKESIKMPVLFISPKENLPDFIIVPIKVIREKGRNIPKELYFDLVYSDERKVKLKYRIIESSIEK